MPDLSLYKVDLDTPQPSGRTGESPRAAFTKYNEALEEIEGGFVPAEAGKGLSTNDYDNAARQRVDGMGTAASATLTESRSDSTLGRVSRVGDHGFGVARPLVSGLDFHELDYGDYAGSVGGVINGPSGVTFFGTVSVRKRFDVADRKVMKASLIIGLHTSRSWTTYQTVDGWTPWYLDYDQSSAVGAVSQEGGVPTGAIIQRGSNVNGEFTRFADGTQIVSNRITTSSSVVTTWAYPVAFLGAPHCISITVDSTSFATVTSQGVGGNSAGINAWGSSGTRIGVLTRCSAKGNWY